MNEELVRLANEAAEAAWSGIQSTYVAQAVLEVLTDAGYRIVGPEWDIVKLDKEDRVTERFGD